MLIHRILQLGIDTVPVLVGPVSYLLLSKPAKGVEKSFSLLSLIDKIIPIYKYGTIYLFIFLLMTLELYLTISYSCFCNY